MSSQEISRFQTASSDTTNSTYPGSSILSLLEHRLSTGTIAITMQLESVLVFVALLLRTHGFTFTPSQHSFASRPREAAAMPHLSSSAEQEVTSGDSKKDDGIFLLPWTDFQDWALRDNILKYVVSIPRKEADKPERHVLWRTLSREVLELSGYPVEMLQRSTDNSWRRGRIQADGIHYATGSSPFRRIRISTVWWVVGQDLRHSRCRRRE
jgi:hypothetical protein